MSRWGYPVIFIKKTGEQHAAGLKISGSLALYTHQSLVSGTSRLPPPPGSCLAVGALQLGQQGAAAVESLRCTMGTMGASGTVSTCEFLPSCTIMVLVACGVPARVAVCGACPLLLLRLHFWDTVRRHHRQPNVRRNSFRNFSAGKGRPFESDEKREYLFSPISSLKYERVFIFLCFPVH